LLTNLSGKEFNENIKSKQYQCTWNTFNSPIGPSTKPASPPIETPPIGGSTTPSGGRTSKLDFSFFFQDLGFADTGEGSLGFLSLFNEMKNKLVKNK